MGYISLLIYLLTYLLCVAAEHGGLIKKKEKENEKCSWVKLKAFPTNVGRPNKYEVNEKK